MFEDDLNFDFDDDFLVKNSEKSVRNDKKANSNKRLVDTISKNVVKRKFPGPAGILPESKKIDSSTFSNESRIDDKLDELVCTQSSYNQFQEQPWLEMMKDFRSEPIFLPDKYNINWIKTKANLNKLINNKAPFLAAIIQNVELYNKKINIILKDLTGEIQGTIIDSLFEQYSNEIKVGSVLVLKQFSVLTTGSNKNHYLTITGKNLVAIYTQSNSMKLQNFSVEDSPKSENFNLDKNIFNLDGNDDLDLSLTDKQFEEVENVREAVPKKKFNFKEAEPNNEICRKNNEAEILRNVLDGVDASCLFEDF